MGIFKWIGGILGFMLFPPLGAIAGMFIGSLIDSAAEDEGDRDAGRGYGGGSSYSGTNQGQRNSFLFSMLVLASYIIRADGR